MSIGQSSSRCRSGASSVSSGISTTAPNLRDDASLTETEAADPCDRGAGIDATAALAFARLRADPQGRETSAAGRKQARPCTLPRRNPPMIRATLARLAPSVAKESQAAPPPCAASCQIRIEIVRSDYEWILERTICEPPTLNRQDTNTDHPTRCEAADNDSRVILEYLDLLAGGGTINPSAGEARFPAYAEPAGAGGRPQWTPPSCRSTRPLARKEDRRDGPGGSATKADDRIAARVASPLWRPRSTRHPADEARRRHDFTLRLRARLSRTSVFGLVRLP